MLKRRTLASFAAAAGIVMAAVLGVAPAHAAVDGTLPYDNTNPSVTGCSVGATTISSYPIKRLDNNATVGTMNVRYSAACGTNWVQVNNTLPGAYVNKYIFRPGDSQTYTANSDFTTDYGAGFSYGMQLGAPGCITVWATLSTTPDNNGRFATTGTLNVC